MEDFMQLRLGRLVGLTLLTVFLFESPVISQRLVFGLQETDLHSSEFFRKIIDIVSHNKNEKECIAKVIQLAENEVDFDSIARRSCTKNYYNELKASDNKALEYMKTMIVNTVLIITKKYDKSNINIGKSKFDDTGRNIKESFSVVVGGEKYAILFVISKKNNKIIDIVCENISLVNMLKTQFYEYIKKHGVENFLSKCKQVWSKTSGTANAN